jgi:hypothetical protein
MNDIVEFKHMNFFTGFFTTAQDWNDGQQYHLEKRKLHNRTMHTPGIVRGEKNELQVLPRGGLLLEVQPGAGLDGLGREIYVGQPQELSIGDGLTGTVYIAIQFAHHDSDYVKNEQEPLYSGYTRVTETFSIQARSSVPDNETWLELARIDLGTGLTEITGADIDRSQVLWAGAVGVVLPELEPEIKERIKDEMDYAREEFAFLASKLPVPSLADVRYAALTIDMLARSNNLETQHARDVLEVLAEVEEDVGQDLGNRYQGIASRAEFEEYQVKVGDLKSSLTSGMTIDELLDAQHDVTAAARDLAEMVLTPAAEAGYDRSATTTGDEATVLLDGGGSRGILDIVKYRWNEVGE